MSDAALQNAVAQVNDLLQQIKDLEMKKNELKERLKKAESFVTEWHEYAGSTTVTQSYKISNIQHSASEKLVSIAPLATRVKNNPKKEVVVELALELIRARGHPINRKELYELLVEHEIVVKGADPLVTFSTMLWRMKGHIVHLNGFGYWDPTLPYGPADYNPNPVPGARTGVNNDN